MKVQIKLENFEGPLELLLHLVEKNEMSIKEINISKIIDDYLHLINEAKEINLKIKIDFLIMATELIEIKAYSILDKEKQEEKEEDLERLILEYKEFKKLSEELKDKEQEYNIPYKKDYKGRNIIPAEVEYDMTNVTIENIVMYFQNIINSFEDNRLIIDIDDDYTTDDAREDILSKISDNKKLYFHNLFEKNISKLKIVTLFLTILELFKENQIYIQNDEEDVYILEMKNV